MDLSPYKPLLDKLVSLSYQHDLDGLLDNLLPAADSQTRFRLQAEVRRLTSPCLRVLDLRSLFPEQCQLVRHQGLDHMLPEPLERRFKALLEEFNGEYTRGLYEALLAELAALRKQPAQFNTPPWQQPAQGTRRKENRLRFVTPVRLHLQDETLQGNSLDISANGLLVQMPYARRLPEQIMVSFPELGQLPGFGCLSTPRRYHLNQSPDEPERIKMRRMDEDDDVQEALTRFIEQKRPRYGLDAEDLYSTARSHCWGRVLLDNSLSLPLFFDGQGELQKILTNRHHGKTLTTWQQDAPGDLLTTLLPPERILQMGRQPLRSLLLYYFHYHGQSQRFHFVADQHELERHQAYSVFINEGLRAGTLHSYYLSIRPLDFTDQDTEALDQQSVRRLQQLKWQLWLTPLPALIAPVPAEVRIQQLAPFIRQARIRKISVTPLAQQASKRREVRFKYQSALELSIAGQVNPGHTEDVSNSGIKIILNEPVRLDLPCLVEVNLTELSTRSRKWKLKNLPYRVVNQSGNGKILHLRIEGKEESHPGFQFFSALLEQNQDKLRARPDTAHAPAWLSWLARQALQQLSAPSFMLGRNEGGFYVQGAIASPSQGELMTFLSNDDHQAHFSQLVSRQQLQSIFSQLLRPDGNSHQCLEIWTAIAADSSEKQWHRINPDASQRAFLLDPRQARGLRVSLLIVNRLQLRQLDYFVPEWNKLTQTSLHKAQQLERQLAELSALGQVFDITDMVRWRQTLNAPAATPAPLQGSAG